MGTPLTVQETPHSPDPLAPLLPSCSRPPTMASSSLGDRCDPERGRRVVARYLVSICLNEDESLTSPGTRPWLFASCLAAVWETSARQPVGDRRRIARGTQRLVTSVSRVGGEALLQVHATPARSASRHGAGGVELPQRTGPGTRSRLPAADTASLRRRGPRPVPRPSSMAIHSPESRPCI